ncbi:hypothetical protein DEFDS_P245 (plasmid) [Deferribacter desulfuricans SSM1]|uniref:Uncharacterized protein n=1 Tax=Deferribacter desulfuricans (strain DSM 14783 / JCM 11476 / NBRC 101012 / SSM1) TaxID=639282 RepID=D3PF73_DEFDS|nr:hypothetical protein [Deferribacter desulfuricans]BAI81865.1 hypothetical protein DEFDS_P245 [Deferribacter desulfuricans SSM1]
MKNKHTLNFKNLDYFVNYINKKHPDSMIQIAILPIPVLVDNNMSGLKGVDTISIIHKISCFIDDLNEVITLEYPSKQQHQITAITPDEKEIMLNKILEKEMDEIITILAGKIDKDIEIEKFCEIE